MATRKTTEEITPDRGVNIRKERSGEEVIRLNFFFRGERVLIPLGVPATARNIMAANRKMAEIRLKISLGEFDPDVARSFLSSSADKDLPTLDEIMSERFDRLLKAKRWEKSTYSKNVKLYKNSLSEIGHLTLPDITPDIIKKFYKRNADRWTIASVQAVMQLLNPVINEALGEGVITRHPYSHIDRRDYFRSTSTRERKEKINPFSLSEMVQFLDAIETPQWRSFWQLLFTTGIRLQEAVVIKWSDIDLKKQELKIDRAIGFIANGGDQKEHKGRGSKARGRGEKEYLKETKTFESRRTIKLSSDAVDALSNMRPLSQLAKGFVFPSSIMGTNSGMCYEWISRGMIRNSWRQTNLLAGLPLNGRSPKQTRHTFASLALMNGEKEMTVAHALGHTNTRMVQLHYGKFMPQDVKPIELGLSLAKRSK